MTPSERLEACRNGTDPRLIGQLPSGFLVLHEFQYWPGYCLLLADPLSARLNDLQGPERVQFLTDMAAVGDALLAATSAVRINYSIYGNLDPFVHAHIVPRYPDEPEPYRTMPPLSVPAEIRDFRGDSAEVAARLRAILFENIRRID